MSGIQVSDPGGIPQNMLELHPRKCRVMQLPSTRALQAMHLARPVFEAQALHKVSGCDMRRKHTRALLLSQVSSVSSDFQAYDFADGLLVALFRFLFWSLPCTAVTTSSSSSSGGWLQGWIGLNLKKPNPDLDPSKEKGIHLSGVYKLTLYKPGK